MFLFATTMFKADIGPTRTLLQVPGLFQMGIKGLDDEACRSSQYNADITV